MARLAPGTHSLAPSKSNSGPCCRAAIKTARTLTATRRCIQTLAAYRRPRTQLRYPKARSAAVLVALFVGRMGDLYVLLSK